MLSWQQVVPFLDHADKRVVARAVQYLADVRGLSVEVTERICNLMDRDDLKDLDYASDWSPGDLFDALAAAPPTMDSVKRLVACSTRGDEARQEDAQPTLRQIDFEFLRDHREELLGMAELNQAIRQGWSERLELINADLEQLWQWFISRSEESGAAWEQKMAQFPPKSDQFDWDRIDRLIEAMARHSNSVERAMKILTDPSIEDWREIYAVRLLGVMRHEPATDLILSKLLIEDADLLHEEVVRSLAKIGTVSVVHKIEAFIPDKDWGVRIFADDPLEHIRLPEAEAALIRLLQQEPESDVRTDLASSLCGQCATEGIGLIQDMVTKEEWDPQIADLDVDLLVTCIMIGRELPGAEEIEKVAKARREDRARRMKQFGPAKSLSSKDRDRVNWEPESPEFSEPVATIQRDSPKIGRNDPCPCGSGKKYKKCCLGKPGFAS